jgi:hypothetical protein
MKYADVRARIESGDLLAWSHRGWDSWYSLKIQAVRMFTRSDYCHLALAMVFDGRVWCVESVMPVIRIVPLSNLIGTEGCYWIPMNAPMTPAEREFALSKVSLGKYSQIEAMRAALSPLPADNQRDDKWECARYAIECRRHSGIELGPIDTPDAGVLAAQDRYQAPVYHLTAE